ncbi:hypothetical protein G6553_07090 [Nocardioides sp. IC4_145]|uniref:hypothetical protein n=1 Tax=Nocardioides sp. IC4_145 TaxID=2714037 RepID=UPI001408EF60|nr:hypothetical protein [Nocardioides sp. IC4_145]NHC22936.1 hypothetical protein [Nocardioides sp. IC4_145]
MNQQRLFAHPAGPALALGLALALAVAGCSNDTDAEGPRAPASASGKTPSEAPADRSAGSPSGPSGSTGAGAEAEEAEQSLHITVSGETITPNGATVDLEVDEPLTIRFTADRAGELHVHSRPEQVLSFKTGNSTAELVIEHPGAADIEEHDTGVVIAQLEVR